MKKELRNTSLFVFVMLLAFIMYSCGKENDDVTNGIEIIDNNGGKSSSKEDEKNKKTGPGFDYPVTETTDTYQITYQFNDNVVAFDDEIMQYLVKTDEGTLYFNTNTPKKLLPEVGNILSSRVTDKTPYGLGNEVISKSVEGGYVKYETSVAALDEIFKELELTSSTPLLPSSTDGIYDEEGNFYEASIEEYDGEIDETAETRVQVGAPKVLVLKKSLEKDKSSEDLKLSVGAILTANISLSNHSYEISLQEFAGIAGSFHYSFRKEGGYKDEKNLIDVISRITLFKSVITLGPIVLYPFLDFSVSLETEVDGELQIGFDKMLSAKNGWTENGWFFENTTAKNEPLISSFGLDGYGEITPIVNFDLGAGLYTKNIDVELTPKLGMSFGASLNLSMENLWRINPTLYGNGFFEVEGGLKAQLFSWKLADIKVSLWKTDLLTIRLPILPEYIYGSLKVSKRSDTSALIFDAQYDVGPSLLGALIGAKPILRIYQDDMELHEVYAEGLSGLGFVNTTTLPYELRGLARNTTYKVQPSIMIGSMKFDAIEYEFVRDYEYFMLESSSEEHEVNEKQISSIVNRTRDAKEVKVYLDVQEGTRWKGSFSSDLKDRFLAQWDGDITEDFSLVNKAFTILAHPCSSHSSILISTDIITQSYKSTSTGEVISIEVIRNNIHFGPAHPLKGEC